MKKQDTWDGKVVGFDDSAACERSEDLVSYLYGELDSDGKRDFERHMLACASCQAESVVFGGVREAIGEWRREALSGVNPVMAAADALRSSPDPTSARDRKRSALAAWREFFSLSPLWLRGATALASAIFCALAIFAIARFYAGPKVVVIEKPAAPGNVQEQINIEVAKRLEKEREAIESASARETASVQDVGYTGSTPVKRRSGTVKVARTVVPRQLRRFAPANLQDEEARYAVDRTPLPDSVFLPFTATRDEDRLPSLSDLEIDNN